MIKCCYYNNFYYTLKYRFFKKNFLQDKLLVNFVSSCFPGVSWYLPVFTVFFRADISLTSIYESDIMKKVVFIKN